MNLEYFLHGKEGSDSRRKYLDPDRLPSSAFFAALIEDCSALNERVISWLTTWKNRNWALTKTMLQLILEHGSLLKHSFVSK